jgi:UDP-N-acetylmuramoyl-tripeptide--D-alanyl-D-alanine ligase
VRSAPLLALAARLHRSLVVKDTCLVAVVGSFGKTSTTKCLLAALTGTVHKKFSANSGFALALNMLRIRPGAPYAVVEAGISKKGQMVWNARLVRPDVTVVTCIGSEHHRSLGTLEVTRDEKAEMVRALGRNGLALLNGDDPNVLWMAGQTAAEVITYGLNPENHVRASDIVVNWPGGTRFKLHVDGETIEAASPFLGKHMVYPVLAAAAVATRTGIDLRKVFARLSQLGPTSGRLQPVPLGNGAVLLRDDAKSTLETIDSALDLFEEIEAGRKIVVLGEVSEPPGSRGPIYRRIGGRVGKTAAAAFFLCNRRSFGSYAGGAMAAGMPSKDDLHHAGSDGILHLIDVLRSELRAGDVVLLKGRNTQRMERITLALKGRTVRCGLSFCDARSTACENCPMLETGWGGHKIVF